MTTVLTDGDPIVYRVGFAGQQRVVHAFVEENGAPYRMRFEGRADRNAWLKEHPEAQIVDEEEELIAEPLPFVLQTVKQCLAPLAALGDVRIYLTGKGNYREKLATVAPYKGNRDPNNRPVHYQAIREYLIQQHGARVIHGREADDELSILATQMRRDRKKYVIATIDKDLDQIPGEHYDYAKHIRYAVAAVEAEQWFWAQVLSGDPTDNIPGCWKIGKEKARAIVDELYLARASDRTIWLAILGAYSESQAKKGCPYADKEPKAVALETARLVWMQREEGELWNPPGEKFGRVEGDADDAG